MTQYGKITEGKLEYAPSILKNKNNYIIISPSHEHYIQCGYKPIIFKETIPAKWDEYHVESYIETEDFIEVYNNIVKKQITNVDIENKRKEKYETLVNQELLPSYNMYMLIGDLEKAEIVKQKIVTVVENIRLQYPYLNEI